MQPRKLFESDYFNYDGHVFFNVSQSGAQGEKYLLNEQLSNIKLATDWRPASWVKWHGLLIYNTSPTPITPALYFEQAFFDFQSGRMPDKYISIGKKWLPFGSYKNDLIYKPLTKALGQTNELALELGYDNVNYASLSFYKPHSTIRSAALPVYYNLNAGRRNQFLDIGASYLYSITDSQLFQYNKGWGGFLGHTVENQVPGAAVYANLKYQDFNTNLTYVTAVRAFHANEMSYQARGAKPAALSVQSGYEFDVRQIPVKFIGFYDHSLQALALKLPRKRAGIGLNIYPSRFLDVQFQVFKDYNYANGVNAAGLNQSVSGNSKITNTVAMQLVLNF
ncbi:LbtU family siderophore porin [Aquicella siphonis]|nr:LbtU family siderophore porin [Aquicella siphonis]